MRTDLLIDDNNDLLCRDGDFVIGASDEQHVSLLLVLNKGELKESPTVGVGLTNYLKRQNTSIPGIKREINVGLKADGYNVKNLEFDKDGEFKMDYELIEK